MDLKMLRSKVSSPSKTEKTIFDSQSLLDRKLCPVSNALDKKTDSASIDIPTKDHNNEINFDPTNIKNKFESNSIALLSSLEYKNTLVDSGKAMLTPYKNENRIPLDADDYYNNTSVISDKEEIDSNRTCNEQFTEDSTNSLLALECSSSDIVDKLIPHKLDAELVRLKSSVLRTTNSEISKDDKRIKEITSNFCSDEVRFQSDLNLQMFKPPIKKSKKGVDSLLEKLESNNKKLYNINGSNLTVTDINIDEKDTNSVKSISPEYCKATSPNNREYDVVSPTFSNEDSNDRKQRRKRKLGKPIRLAKDIKLDQEDMEADTIKDAFLENPRNLNHFLQSDEDLFHEDSLFETDNQQHLIEKIHLGSIEESNLKVYLMRNQDKKNYSNIDNPEMFKSQIGTCTNRNCNSSSQSNISNSKRNYNVYSKQYLKDGQYTKVRRSSECYNDVKEIMRRNKKKRRKSCNDIFEGLNKLDSKRSISANLITFNEVESQLEKMFAGIIESDNDLLKKNFVSDTRSVVIMTDDDQKENLNLKTHLISPSKTKLTCINNDEYKKSNKKDTSKMSSHRKKSESDFGKISDISVRKPHIAYTSTFKKSNILNRKKKKINIENFQEMMYDSALPYNSYKYKGPIIQTGGSGNCSLRVKLINIPGEDDEERLKEKKKVNVNAITSRGTKFNYQNADCHGKVHSIGSFNSKLPPQYNSCIADVTWICVFCKKGPHCVITENSSLIKVQLNSSEPQMFPNVYTISSCVLGDLFGPYAIETNYIDDDFLSSDELELTNEVKEADRKIQLLRYTGITEQLSSKHRKKKKFSNNVRNSSLGMEMLYGEKNRWEVWVHEQCIVWTAGVYINGGRISGLEDAVWESARTPCNYCDLYGANIKCIRRGCKSVVHYCCALTTGWYLDVHQYIPKCNNHIAI